MKAARLRNKSWSDGCLRVMGRDGLVRRGDLRLDRSQPTYSPDWLRPAGTTILKLLSASTAYPSIKSAVLGADDLSDDVEVRIRALQKQQAQHVEVST